jgi:hypothetical protein
VWASESEAELKPTDEILKAQQKLDQQRRAHGVTPKPTPKKKRNYTAERSVAATKYVNRIATIRENAEENTLANGHTETDWIVIAKALSDCPLPFRPTKSRQLTKRTRFDGKWCDVTYTCMRKGVAMPHGKDGRLMHWLIDKAVQAGRNAVKMGREPSREVTWSSTYGYLQDLGMSDSDENYKGVKQSFKRLSGLGVAIEFEGPGDKGKVFTFLDSWNLPKSIDAETAGQQTLDLEQYGFTLNEHLFSHAMKYLVCIPRSIWRLTKGNPQKGALLLWAFTRAYAAASETLITWDVLREQFWYDDSNPWRLKSVMKQIATLLTTMWPGARMTITEQGVVFDKAISGLLPDDPMRGRVRRNK